MTLTDSQIQSFHREGFLLIPDLADAESIQQLQRAFDTGRPQRNVLSIPEVQTFVRSSAVQSVLHRVFPRPAFAVRAIFFAKSDESNWKVAWHQDLTIAVQAKHEVPGFGPWSEKAGVIHVQPPAEIMSQMAALRFHLDENTPDNGPLRVFAGSHLSGRFSIEGIDLWKSRVPVECLTKTGDAILMRPLLLHASSTAKKPFPRRVLHVEFADFDLPALLEWNERVE
jgi:ectoine hydroxylase-related dioxygenase (phytanoyl-CoA dioxygenase family)